MPNTVIAIRQSGATGNTPSLGVLANGELSLNFADGILYYKTAANTLGSIRTTQPAGLTTEIQFNDAGSFGSNSAFNFNKTTGTLNVRNIIVSTNLATTNLTATSITTGSGEGGIITGANVIYSNTFVANSTTTSTSNSTGAIISNGGLGVRGNVYADAIYDGGVEVISFANQAFTQANSANILAQAAFNQANTALSNTNLNVSGTLRMLNQGGEEGGELFLDRPVTNTSLAAGVTIDIYQNKLRIFETGGSVRGVFIDIANSAAAGVGTDLLNPAAIPDTVARTTANAAFNQANSANVLAQAAFNQANTANIKIDSGYAFANSVNIKVDGAFAFSNTVNIKTDAAFVRANAANVLAQAAFDKANQTAQLAFTTVSANGTSLVADANNDTLTITANTANGIQVLANSTTDTLDLGLRASGVTAGVYGNSSTTVTITIDQFGRITSVSQTAVTFTETDPLALAFAIALG